MKLVNRELFMEHMNKAKSQFNIAPFSDSTRQDFAYSGFGYFIPQHTHPYALVVIAADKQYPEHTKTSYYIGHGGITN
jgi:hypothetical protein